MDYPLSRTAELGLVGGKFTDGVPGVSPASIDPSQTTNNIIDELLALIVYCGLVPDEDVVTQIRDGLVAKFAQLAGPAFTGAPTAPTAAPGTNTTQVATTAFVAALGALKASLAGSSLQTFAIAQPSSPNHAVDLQQFTGSISSSGYVQIPIYAGGIKRNLLIQWGFTATTVGAGVSSTTTFAQTFPTACLHAVMTDSSAVGNGAVVWASDATNTTNFTAFWNNSGTAPGSTSRSARYFAIGY